ncbi:MAG: phosphate ABC transporter permease PstA [Gammaproteobacteria bacterium]
MIRKWIQSGKPWIWLSASAVSISMVMVFGLLFLIAVRGLHHFWPSELVSYDYTSRGGSVVKLVGEVHETESVSTQTLVDAGFDVDVSKKQTTRYLVKVGNREIAGQDFRWLLQDKIQKRDTPKELIAMERREWGNFYGYLIAVKQQGKVVAEGDAAFAELSNRVERALIINEKIQDIQHGEIGSINYQLERLRLKERALELKDNLTPVLIAEIESQRLSLQNEYKNLEKKQTTLYQQINRDSVVMQTADGRSVEIPLAKAVLVYQPNKMSASEKIKLYFSKLWEFVSEEPREANTEGGIFPAIFGTVMMVIIMSIMVTPFGVVAAVYLREYARQGPLTRLIRIAVNNLAGVPSIVYGVFGLGFFVYFLGGNIDQLFYPEALPAPTFGTPGILWASLTLSILTVPVVIVATEEGLSRIPKSIREGSLALGATKAETLWRTILPMASPAMMTGLILAVARAAGEVAPLMLVGVVKLAPSLPLDGNFPFMHLDRKFMHLGFHIFDVGFQSPNVEAARPLVYATALLLVLVIVVLNLAAIGIRNHLREKYRALEN